MKRVIRSALSIFLMLAVVLSFVPAISAAEDDSVVTFYGLEQGFGFAPGSEYTDSDLFDNFKNVYPGDRLTETVTVKNVSGDSDFIKLYIRAEAYGEDSLPEGIAASGETVASMSEFLAQLSMKVWLGDADGELIYDASPDELDGFENSVYLGSVRKDETVTLTVELDVPFELDNRFQNRVGAVNWIFTAELFDDPVPPEDKTYMTVHKVWDDDGADRPDSIRAELLRDGEKYADAVLNDDNAWTFTWGDLEEDHDWTVREAEVPEGYTVSYDVLGNIVTIINTADKGDTPPPPPKDPVKRTVKIEWDDEDDIEGVRPDSVPVTLFNGTEAVETVVVGPWNNWTFTWEGLDGDGDWKIILMDVPEGYVPTYSHGETVLTITLVSSLAQTGQLKWPVPVLAFAGIAMIAAGGFVILRKRKKEND